MKCPKLGIMLLIIVIQNVCSQDENPDETDVGKLSKVSISPNELRSKWFMTNHHENSHHDPSNCF